MNFLNFTKMSGMLLAAFFAALTAICSVISIPLPFTPIPVNLATLSVFLAGTLLGPRYGLVSQIVYILLGAAGLPVFHSFTGGVGIIAGPTGGYILGYAASAFVIGFLCSIMKKYAFWRLILILTAGLAACYIFGTLWFLFSTGTALIPALMSCVVPFIPGDVLKIAVAAILTGKLHSIILRNF